MTVVLQAVGTRQRECVCMCLCMCTICSYVCVYYMYRMVGNFHEEFIFAFFASREPFAKIKTVKILQSTCEQRFNPRPTWN